MTTRREKENCKKMFKPPPPPSLYLSRRVANEFEIIIGIGEIRSLASYLIR